MATAQRVFLSLDAVATVAALNAAVTAVTAAPNTYLAAPIDLGDSLVVTSSDLGTPNTYTGLVFDSISNDDLRLDLAAVGTFMSALTTQTGVRWAIQTRFGYTLIVRGQPASVWGSGLVSFSDDVTVVSNTGTNFPAGIFTTLVTPVLPVGTWRLGFQFELRTSGGAATGAADGQVTLDATEIAIGSRLSNPATTWSVFSGFASQTFGVAAAHTIVVSVARNGGAGPPPTNAQMRRVHLMMYKVLP